MFDANELNKDINYLLNSDLDSCFNLIANKNIDEYFIKTKLNSFLENFPSSLIFDFIQDYIFEKFPEYKSLGKPLEKSLEKDIFNKYNFSFQKNILDINFVKDSVTEKSYFLKDDIDESLREKIGLEYENIFKLFYENLSKNTSSQGLKNNELLEFLLFKCANFGHKNLDKFESKVVYLGEQNNCFERYNSEIISNKNQIRFYILNLNKLKNQIDVKKNDKFKILSLEKNPFYVNLAYILEKL